MELAPKRREPAPETHRIRRDHAVPVEVEPAKLMTNQGSTKDAAWWQKLPGLEKKPTAIPLPRTDVEELPPQKHQPQIVEKVETDTTEPAEFW